MISNKCYVEKIYIYFFSALVFIIVFRISSLHPITNLSKRCFMQVHIFRFKYSLIFNFLLRLQAYILNIT